MATITIAQDTDLATLSSWIGEKHESLTFVVYPNSGFGFAAEPIAQAVLAELNRDCPSINVDCRFDLIAEAKDPKGRIGLFDTIFGLALAWNARTVTVNGEHARHEVLRCLWKRVKVGDGEIGGGRQRSLVSRDPDEPLPERLALGISSFPNRERFGTVLFGRARTMGFGLGSHTGRQRYSRDEEGAITFLYEVSRNSFEHGRFSASGEVIRGFHGVVLEKLAFASPGEIETRRTMPRWQREYVRRIWPSIEQTHHVFSYSVVDLGLGIQNTLPAVAGEDAWSRLNRAFSSGQTRKPRGTDVEAGQGLARVYEAATQLQALLLVKSGGLLGFADFSNGTLSAKLHPWPQGLALGNVGTCLTLMWPERSSQQRLF